MSAHFAAVNSIFLPHPLFYKSVTGFAFNCRTACVLDDIFGIPIHTWVVNNFVVAVFVQKCLSQQTNNVIPFDKITVGIEQEAAVKITVPRNTKVSAVFNNCICRICTVFW